MKVVCAESFFDLEEKVMREKGDTFDCTAQRLKAINGTKYGTLAEKAPAKREAKTEE